MEADNESKSQDKNTVKDTETTATSENNFYDLLEKAKVLLRQAETMEVETDKAISENMDLETLEINDFNAKRFEHCKRVSDRLSGLTSVTYEIRSSLQEKIRVRKLMDSQIQQLFPNKPNLLISFSAIKSRFNERKFQEYEKNADCIAKKKCSALENEELIVLVCQEILKQTTMFCEPYTNFIDTFCNLEGKQRELYVNASRNGLDGFLDFFSSFENDLKNLLNENTDIEFEKRDRVYFEDAVKRSTSHNPAVVKIRDFFEKMKSFRLESFANPLPSATENSDSAPQDSDSPCAKDGTLNNKFQFFSM